jgi:pimeloyl-ACP methyl ester carboxylesterase
MALDASVSRRTVVIDAGSVPLEGELALPAETRGIVVFAHGSGSSRHSPRNAWVASFLNRAGLTTLLFDLLSAEEERRDRVTAEHRFDIPLLASRLVAAVGWVRSLDATSGLGIGLFGASTGAGAALIAAAEQPNLVGAVVSRGGRPDLADEALRRVQAPTLLIVGELDVVVQTLNEDAMMRMSTEVNLAVVPGASHLFEEAGTLEQAAALARDWFIDHLTDAAARP